MIVSVAAKGSIVCAQREEGRMALVASKPTTIALRWVALDEVSFMGVYGWTPAPVDATATPALFLPLLWRFQLFSAASLPMVGTLAKPIALAYSA